MEQDAFPVIDSTLSPTHLAGWVADQYNFKNVSCRLLKTNMNHSYLIRTGNEDYVLRVYNHNHRDRLQVTEEVQLLDAIKNNVGVAYPVADVSGVFVNEIEAPEGKRCVVLFTYAKGKRVRNL